MGIFDFINNDILYSVLLCYLIFSFLTTMLYTINFKQTEHRECALRLGNFIQEYTRVIVLLFLSKYNIKYNRDYLAMIFLFYRYLTMFILSFMFLIYYLVCTPVWFVYTVTIK